MIQIPSYILGVSVFVWLIPFICFIFILLCFIGINLKLSDIRRLFAEHNDILKQQNKLIDDSNIQREIENNFKSRKLSGN